MGDKSIMANTEVEAYSVGAKKVILGTAPSSPLEKEYPFFNNHRFKILC